MTVIDCVRNDCVHCQDNRCTCNMIFINPQYLECEMYEERKIEEALKDEEYGVFKNYGKR